MLHDDLLRPSSSATCFAMLCALVITQICRLDLLQPRCSWSFSLQKMQPCSCECILQQTHISNGLSPMQDVHLPLTNNETPGAQRVLNIIPGSLA